MRSDLRSSFGEFSGTAEGISLQIALTIEDAATCAPLEQATVYLWHCDRSGAYSLYTVTDQNYLRGVQAADAEGLVRLPASSRPATQVDGRTSTSRSTRIRRPRRTTPT